MSPGADRAGRPGRGRGGPFEDYETWLAAFEGVLAAKGLVRADKVEESAYAFEYGERDDVY